jgi:hypothetical protein
MDREKQEALAAIDRAAAWVREQREKGFPPLSSRYLRHIARVEALPQNQSGSDKSWLRRSDVRDREHFRRARRVRG